MNRRQVQTERNRASQLAWQEFATHRDHVMDRIRNAMSRARKPRLCVLGAGNCNDVSLRDCLEQCHSVTLVDLDKTALDEAAIRQQVEADPRLHLVEADLAADLPQAIAGEKWDIVVSTCLLSQLIESAVAGSDNDEPRSQLAMRASEQHVQCMTDLVSENGIGLLISDFVSSETIPELLHLPDEQIAEAAKQCLVGGNFFAGTNPFLIRAKLQDSFGFSSRIVTPWRWRLGNRAFIVYSLEFGK